MVSDTYMQVHRLQLSFEEPGGTLRAKLWEVVIFGLKRCAFNFDFLLHWSLSHWLAGAPFNQKKSKVNKYKKNHIIISAKTGKKNLYHCLVFYNQFFMYRWLTKPRGLILLWSIRLIYYHKYIKYFFIKYFPVKIS